MATTTLSPTVRSEFKVLCQGPKVTSVIEAGKWRLVPLELDTAPIPPHALVKVQRLFEPGIRPEQFLVAHELELPKVQIIQRQVETRGVDWDRALMAAKVIALVTGAALAIAALVAVVVAFLAAIVVGAVVVAAIAAAIAGIAYDPVLVAVLEDGTWLEVDRWN